MVDISSNAVTDGGNGAGGEFPVLDHIDIWLFDLDNTLYPARCNLFAQIDIRINQYVSTLLDLGLDEARIIQKKYFSEFGTTLKGLMNDHQVDPHHYMSYVHDIDISVIDPTPELDDALRRLPGRKLIFTNGSVEHANNITNRLGIHHHFEAVFDIAASDFVPKPALAPYEALVSRHDIAPHRTAFFDDVDRNLAPAAAIGMTTVWVPGSNSWSGEGTGDYIHHVAPELTPFLDGVLAASQRG